MTLVKTRYETKPKPNPQNIKTEQHPNTLPPNLHKMKKNY